jgi:ankyrin repeat protein
MSKDLKDEYVRVHNQLQGKQQEISRLEQQKANLQAQSGSLQILQQLDGQIKILQADINKLSPEHARLEAAYQQTLQTNQGLTGQITSLNQQIATSQNLQSQYNDFFNSIDAILAEYSAFEGQSIDTTVMVVKKLPKKEMHNSQALKEACAQQSREAFDVLLTKMGEDINLVDSQGMTLLMYSLKHGFWYGVEKLLALGADVNITDKNSCNALIYACTLPHMKYIKLIAERIENINSHGLGGSTALHLALDAYQNIYASEVNLGLAKTTLYSKFIADEDCSINMVPLNGIVIGNCTLTLTGNDIPSTSQETEFQKTLDVIQILVNNGAELNCQDQYGRTPFYLACIKGNIPALSLLKNLGADVNKLIALGFHPIHGAIHNGHTNIIEELLKFGVSIDIKSISGHTPLQYYCEQPDSIPEVVGFLLSKGADINCQDASGRTPFYMACLQGNMAMMKLLKDSGADINKLSASGFHPIHGAVYNDHTNIIEELLKFGISIDTKSTSGYTPLQYYCELAGNKLELVQFLLAKGAGLNCVQGDNIKPLLYSAVISNNIELVGFLISQKGLDVNCQTTDKISPLYCSMGYHGQPIKMEMVEFLVNKGADVNHAVYDGDTPMHMAGYRSRVDIMETLFSNGANINAKNHDGKTALNLVIEQEGYATSQQKILAARYLLNHGGIIGKGADEASVVAFLEIVQSFTGPDEVLVQQENVIQCLHVAKQCLTLPAEVQIIAENHDMLLPPVELGLTGDLSSQDN